MPTLERCTLAARTLAISDKSLRERILDAYVHHLAPLRAEDFPEDARASFAKLEHALSRVPSEKNGSARASIEAASDEEVRDLAKLVWNVIESVLHSASPGHR